MQRSMTIKIIRNSFWLSILLHLLLILAMFAAIILAPDEDKAQKSPHLFVPSYMYTGSIKPMTVQQSQASAQAKPMTDNTQEPVSKPEAETTRGIDKLEKTNNPTGLLQTQKQQQNVIP